MWYRRRLGKISCIDRVGNEVLRRVIVEKKTVGKIKRREANWIGHVLCRNWLLKHVTEGRIEEKI